jgi:hypothetical protein
MFRFISENRLAIRAARFGPGADVTFWGSGRTTNGREICRTVKNRGRFKGAIRIPLRSLSLFFNNLALRRIPCKPLKSLPLLFSIPTAPTNYLPDWSGLNKFTRGQKGADKAIDPVPVS